MGWVIGIVEVIFGPKTDFWFGHSAWKQKDTGLESLNEPSNAADHRPKFRSSS